MSIRELGNKNDLRPCCAMDTSHLTQLIVLRLMHEWVRFLVCVDISYDTD